MFFMATSSVPLARGVICDSSLYHGDSTLMESTMELPCLNLTSHLLLVHT